MKNYLAKGFLFGIISWLVPFVTSFGFYKPEGELAIDYELFKSIMVVVSSCTGIVLLILYSKHLETDPVARAVIIGSLWFAINIVLDTVILIPMSSMSYESYFYSIGIRYLTIPAFSIGVGFILKKRTGT
jgi:hypothetical protein